ncbi:hypothetical protein ACE41H_23320 [Paenibacillus enshidis]|uniref:Uncharacterized protein n=1 Tax=Paenibacillus enshidis TaxID=1458439 RepID=A0ABV5AZP0_9BACL
MSLPNVPNITPVITVNFSEAINVLLVSIAMEEISLSHIINAEAERIQFVLGTLHESGAHGSIDDIIKVNKDVRQTLTEVVRKELLLQMKLEAVLNSTPPALHVASTQPPYSPDQPGSSSYPTYR